MNGTFEDQDKEKQIQMRVYRPSTTNEKTTTQSNFYLRTRHRNTEKQTPFMRTTSIQNDATRIQDIINDRFKVDFEPFDAKALLNHKFREECPAQWRNSKGFTKTMKTEKIGPKDKLTSIISTAEPFVNSLDHMGMLLLQRNRDKTKETSNKPFNTNLKEETRE